MSSVFFTGFYCEKHIGDIFYKRNFGAKIIFLVHRPDFIFYIYIVTNPNRTTLYTGVTNNISARVTEHWDNRGQPETFAGKYFCYNLIYYETYQYIETAIAREKEIKKWSRKKKEDLIATKNPEWVFLNEKICGSWPPKKIIKRF